MAVYKEIHCQEAMRKLKRKIPYSWDLNLYRGCEHGCRYCYAMYSHEYLGTDAFYEEIFVKTNVAEQLERQLASPKWNREVINIGGVTDSYQPAEGSYKLMPEILKLLIRYRTPCIISTKSDLILRDFDLIEELSRITYVNVAETITAMDEDIRRKIEPGGVSSERRFQVLKEFARTEASRGLHFMPIIPWITDGYENIDALYQAGRDSEVSYVLPGTLYLRGAVRPAFFSFIQREFPDLYEPLSDLYRKGGAGKEYKDGLYKMVGQIREKYGLNSSYSKIMKEKLGRQQEEYVQLSLFDENTGGVGR